MDFKYYENNILEILKESNTDITRHLIVNNYGLSSEQVIKIVEYVGERYGHTIANILKLHTEYTVDLMSSQNPSVRP